MDKGRTAYVKICNANLLSLNLADKDRTSLMLPPHCVNIPLFLYYQHRETNLVHYRKFSEQAIFLIILFYHFRIFSEDSNLLVKYPKTEVYNQFFHFQLPIAEKKIQLKLEVLAQVLETQK